MTFLMNIPFVMPVARWIWGDDINITPEICIESLPLMIGPCWSRLIVKGLGIGIILGACLNKLPIILNLINSKSTAGLSRTSIYGEIIVCSNAAFYGILEGHPFTAFGENVALVLQSMVITLMVWQYSMKEKPVPLYETLSATALYILYVLYTFTILPTHLNYILVSTNLPIMLYSRGSQVLETFRTQHTGAQSIVTTSMNVVGTIIRVLTTIKEVGWDMAILSGLCVSLGLNLTMFAQYFYYQSNTEKFLRALKDQAEKKEN